MSQMFTKKKKKKGHLNKYPPMYQSSIHVPALVSLFHDLCSNYI